MISSRFGKRRLWDFGLKAGWTLLALVVTLTAGIQAQEAVADDPVLWTAAEIIASDLSYEDKLSALNRQLVLNPQNPELYNNLGALYAEHEEWELARDAFIRAVQADPRNPGNHRNLGHMFVRLGMTDMAVMEFEAYRNFSIDGAFDAPVLIGGAWAESGDVDRADAIYREALVARGNAYDEHVAQMVVRLARSCDEREDTETLEELLHAYVEPAQADIVARGGPDADPTAALSATIVERQLVLWIQQARQEAQDGNHVAAAEIYEKVQVYDPHRPDLLAKIAETWLNAGDAMKAKVIAQRAVTDDPDDPAGWKAKARIADKQGQTRDALAAYEKVFELDASQLDVAARIGQLYMTIGDNTSARRYMGLVASDPDTPVELLFNYALSLQREDLFSLSAAPLRKVVERQPDHAPAWRALGAAHRHGKDYADAEKAYARALELAPDPRTAFQVGFCASRAGRLEAAVAAYRATTDLDPTYVKAWYNLALAEIRLKDYEAALQDLEVLGMLEGDQYRVFFNKGLCYSNLGRSEDAIVAYEMALDLKETSAAWNNLAVVYQRSGQPKKAETCIKMGEELKAEGR